MSNDIEVSSSGIKFSYLRFLSDSAPGFILLIVFLYCYYTNAVFLGFNFDKMKVVVISDHERIAFLLLLFLLSTPVGKLINLLSFYFLDWLDILISSWWLNKKVFLTKAINITQNYQELKDFFGLTKGNFTYLGFRYYYTLHTTNQVIIKDIEHFRGSRIFLRSASFLFAILVIGNLFASYDSVLEIVIKITIVLIVVIIISFLNSLCLYYQHLLTLNKVYSLCIETGEELKLKNERILVFISKKATGSTKKATGST